MVRPQGDVLFLYQEVLPILARGVIVHIHDIFTPYDYPDEWLRESVIFWNEQYLLEAFLAFNGRFKVLAALHMLYKEHRDALLATCPILAVEQRYEPRSMWLQCV
jgi:hypothetical protein